MIAGVAGGIATRIGRDATVVRIVLVLFGLVSGFGVAAYVLAWLFLPVEGSTETIGARALSDRQGITIVLAAIPALVIILLLGSVLHANFVSSWGTPLLIAAAGLVLVARNAEDDERGFLVDSVKALLQLDSEPRQSRRSFLIRLGSGVVLLALGVLAISEGSLSRSWLRPFAGTLLIVAGTVVLLGPWWLRLALDLVHERQARIRAEERADMAARVHDSVLQTLALIQRSADQPQEVAKLARAQERELRSWLFEGRAPGSFGTEGAATLSAGVEQIEREVEAAHGVAVDAVTVGDAPLDEELRALLEAGREATVNAAKWSGASSVSIYVEAEPRRVSMFVRDRGAGFDSEAVAGDRKGIAESIHGRMQRHGGTAVIRSVPGEGTEVELTVPRRQGRP
jgi:signal transduction histidine kinase